MSSSSTGVRAARGLLAACAVLLGSVREAGACSVILSDTPERVRCDAPATDAGPQHTVAPAVALEVQTIEVRRSRYPPPGLGDCGELGSVAVQFRLAGSMSWPGDVGVLINHVSGEFPWFLPPVASTSAGSGWLLGTAEGRVSFFGPDDPREPLDVHLVARLIDCTGATSAPNDVVIADPGRPDDAQGTASEPSSDGENADAGVGERASSSSRASGCTMSLAPRPAPGTGLGSLLALAIARRRWRRRAR